MTRDSILGAVVCLVGIWCALGALALFVRMVAP